MNIKTETILNEILTTLNSDDFPPVTEAKIVIGSYSDRLPLVKLRELFSVIKVGFIPTNTEYAYLYCKLNKESVITFEARVSLLELNKVEKITTTYEVPEIPILEDREPVPLEIPTTAHPVLDDPHILEEEDVLEDVTISIEESSDSD